MRGSKAPGLGRPRGRHSGLAPARHFRARQAEPKRNQVMATVHDWIDACRRQGITLRRRGQEHCGPCPICQTGDDRFWIKPGRVQPVLARCRHGHTYRQLHRALLGDSFDTPVRPRRRRHRRAAPSSPTRHFPTKPTAPAGSSPSPIAASRRTSAGSSPDPIGSSGRTATCGSCR